VPQRLRHHTTTIRAILNGRYHYPAISHMELIKYD